MLLLDVLINFSPLYIPDMIGGRMGLPLLINRIVYPDEVDEQAHSVDTCWTYQLQYYEVSMKGAKASEIPHLLRTLIYDLKAGTSGRGVGYTHVQSSLIRIEATLHPTLPGIAAPPPLVSRRIGMSRRALRLQVSSVSARFPV